MPLEAYATGGTERRETLAFDVLGDASSRRRRCYPTTIAAHSHGPRPPTHTPPHPPAHRHRRRTLHGARLAAAAAAYAGRASVHAAA
jgi:hypothetical protein